MRRLILIALMLVLPLQWSWAAAASVCEHEAAGAHFGHHAHEHEAAGADPAEPAQNAEGNNGPSSHPDCQVCHGIGVAHLSSAADAGPAWVPERHLAAYRRHLPEPPPESLLRPPLILVA